MEFFQWDTRVQRVVLCVLPPTSLFLPELSAVLVQSDHELEVQNIL